MAVSPVECPYIPAKYRGAKQTPTLSVIHSTVGPTKAGSARAIARYGQNPSSPSSWHYAIDAAEVIQSVYDHTVAYHCGFNSDSLGYEMCDNPSHPVTRWLGLDHRKMLDRTARTVARNHAAYGIPVRYLSDDQLRAWNANGRKAKDGGIATHAQMSRVFKRSSHWDPGKWPAKKFLSLVKKYHAELVAPAPRPISKRLSVMTWNVENKNDGPADVAALRDLLAEQKPDVVCLQEAYRLDLAGIPGYRDVYHASKGYPVNSENRAQAILVRDGVSVKIKNPIVMTLSWIGPKMGLRRDPRIHRYVTVNKDRKNWRVSTWHVPFGPKPVEETRLAAIGWLKQMGALGPAIAVGDWNSLADGLYGTVGAPAKATVDGGGLDKAVFRGCDKVKGENFGKLGRSDHNAKIWTFEA